MVAQAKTILAIDARCVVTNQSHGIARHTDELVRRLFDHTESPHHFVLLVTRHSPYLTMSLPKHVSLRVLRSGWISLLGQFELAWALLRLKPFLFHSPSFVVPLLSSTPFIATIHDLIHVVMARDYTWFHKLYYGFFLARKIRKAQAIMTVSEFSKNEIVRIYGVDPEKVRVIYNGISRAFLDQPPLTKVAAEEFREKYELPKRFILSIGNKKAHKNMMRLVEGWCKANTDCDLVVLTEFDPKLLHVATPYNKRHRIYFVRFIPDEDLPTLYSLATTFVYPSLYEGFGLPPLEAAACGIPVVVSNRSSLPEVMQNCAIYVDPENVDDIARGIKESLNVNSQGIKDNITRGLKLATSYTWDEMTNRALAIYEQCRQEMP